MARWELVAEGPLGDIQAKVADRELPKGTRVKMIMDLALPVGSIFDAAGAEWIFRPFVPDGFDMVDVYGDGSSKGVVEMEADPGWLLAAISFIRANWAAIIISGFVLGVIVVMARMFILIVGAAEDWLPVILLIGGIVLVLAIIGARPKQKRRSAKG